MKVTRAVRLTLMLEMKVAEIVRDIRAGVVTHSAVPVGSKNAGKTPAVLGTDRTKNRLEPLASRRLFLSGQRR